MDYKREKDFIKYCIYLKVNKICQDEWGLGGILIRDVSLHTLEVLEDILNKLEEKNEI